MPKMPIKRNIPGRREPVNPGQIDTRDFGLALDFNTLEHPGYMRVKFDTGLIMLVPFERGKSSMFDNMVFGLEEKDPEPPRG